MLIEHTLIMITQVLTRIPEVPPGTIVSFISCIKFLDGILNYTFIILSMEY